MCDMCVHALCVGVGVGVGRGRTVWVWVCVTCNVGVRAHGGGGCVKRHIGRRAMGKNAKKTRSAATFLTPPCQK